MKKLRWKLANDWSFLPFQTNMSTFLGFPVRFVFSELTEAPLKQATFQGEVSSTALAMFYRSDLARQGGSGWGGMGRCRCPMAGWLNQHFVVSVHLKNWRNDLQEK